MAKAKYYLLTSDFIDGARGRAHRLGVKAVPADDVLPEALAIAERLATGPSQATLLTKRALNHWLRQALPNFEASLAYEMLNFLGPDAAEGVAALPRTPPPRVPVKGPNVAMDRDLAADLAFGLELAKMADGISLPYYEQRSFNLDWKANRTEVTEADRETESAIAASVATRRPGEILNSSVLAAAFDSLRSVAVSAYTVEWS